VVRRAEAEANLVAADVDHLHFDIIADHHGFITQA
jgi:hypothetical protein